MWGEVRSVWTCLLLFVLFNGDLLLVESRGGISSSGGEECPCIPRDQCPRIYGKSALDIRELGFMSACNEYGTVRCCGVSISVVQKNSDNFMNPATDLNTLNNDDGDLIVSETSINENEALPARRKKIIRRRRPGDAGKNKNSTSTTITNPNQIEGQKYEEKPAENDDAVKKETITTSDETPQINSEKPRNPMLNGKRIRPLRPIRPISSQRQSEPIVEQSVAPSTSAAPEIEKVLSPEPETESPIDSNTQTLEAGKTGYVHKSPPRIRPFNLRRRPNITRLSTTNVGNEEHTEVLPGSLPVESEKPVESSNQEQPQSLGYDKVISEPIQQVKIKPIHMRRRPLSSIPLTTSEAPAVEYPSSTEYIHNPPTLTQNVPEPNEKYERRTTTTEEPAAPIVVGSHYRKNGYSSQEQISEVPQKQSLRKRLKPFRKFPSKQNHLPLVEEQKSEELYSSTTTAPVVPNVEEAPRVENNHNYGYSPAIVESQKEEIFLPSSTEIVYENIPSNSGEHLNSYGGESNHHYTSKPEQISSMGQSIVLDHIKDGVVVLDERNSFVDKNPIIIQAATDAPLQPQQSQLQQIQTPLTKRRRILSHRPQPQSVEIQEPPKTSKPINIHSENNHVRNAGSNSGNKRPASTLYAYSNPNNEDPVRMTSQYSRIRLGNEENEENDDSVNTSPVPHQYQSPTLNEGKKRFSISNIFSKTTSGGPASSAPLPAVPSEELDDQNENYDLILDQDNRKDITPQQQLLKIRNPGYYPSTTTVDKKEKVVVDSSEAQETRAKPDYGNNNSLNTRKELASPQSLLKRVKVSKEPVNSYSQQQVQVSSSVSNQQQLQQKKHQKSRIRPNMRLIKRPTAATTQTPNLNLRPKARPESYSTEQVGQIINSQKQYTAEQTQINNNDDNTSSNDNDGYESTTQKFIFPPFKRTKTVPTSVTSNSNYNSPPIRVRSTTSAPTTVATVASPAIQVFANQYQYQSTESAAKVEQIYPTTTEYAIVREKPEIIYQYQAPSSTSKPEILNVKVSTKYESALDLPTPHKSSTSHRFKVPDSFFSTPDLQPQSYYKPPVVEENISYVDMPVVEDSRPQVQQKQRIRIKVKDDQQKEQHQYQQQTKGYIRFPESLSPHREIEEKVKSQDLEENITEQPKYEQNIPQKTEYEQNFPQKPKYEQNILQQQKFEQNIPQPQQKVPEQQHQHTFITPAMTSISFGTDIDGEKFVQNSLPTPVPSPSPIPLLPIKHHVTSSEIVHQPDLIKESEKTHGQIPLFHQQQKLQQSEIVHHQQQVQQPLHPEIFSAKPLETSLPVEVSQPPVSIPPPTTPFFSNFDQGSNKTHTYVAFGTQLENGAKTSFRPQHQLPIQQPQVQTLIKQQLTPTPQIPAQVNHQYFIQPQTQSQQIHQQHNIHNPNIQNQGLQQQQQQQQQFFNNHQYTKQERLPTIYNHQQQVLYHHPTQQQQQQQQQLLKSNSYHQNQNHYQMPPQHIQFGTQIQQQQQQPHNMNQHFPLIQPQQTHSLSQKEIESRPGQLKNEYQHHLSITEQILSRLKNTIRMSRATNMTLMDDNGINGGGQNAPESISVAVPLKEQSPLKKPPTTKMEKGIIGAVEVIRKLTSQPVVTKVEQNKQEKSKLSAKSPTTSTKSVNSTKTAEIEPQQFPGIPIPPEKNEFQPPKVIQGGFMPIVPYYSFTDPGPKLVKVDEEQKLIKDEKITTAPSTTLSPPKSTS